MLKMLDSILFPGFEGYKLRITNENPKRISIYDVIGMIENCNSNRSSIIFKRIKENNDEVASIDATYKFPGPGQKETPIADGESILKIINYLQGKRAALFRVKQANILRRYLGGDETLVGEIRNNAQMQSNLPDNHPMTLFKSTTEEQLSDRQLEIRKLDHIERMKQLDLQEKQLELQEKQIEIESKKQQIDELETRKNIAIESVDVLIKLNGGIDPVTKLFFTDIIKNTSSSSSNLLAIEASSQSSDVQERRLMNPISDIYSQINNKPGDTKVWSRIGKQVAKEYRRRYNKAPTKSERFIAGTTRMVNVYCLKDNPWIKEYCLDL